jgi:hypothetical protein
MSKYISHHPPNINGSKYYKSISHQITNQLVFLQKKNYIEHYQNLYAIK